MRPALAGSCEHLFHDADLDQFLLVVNGASGQALGDSRLQRAIGVIYRPTPNGPATDSIRFNARLPDQFDGLIHLDRATDIEPLSNEPALWDEGEPPEMFPTGL